MNPNEIDRIFRLMDKIFKDESYGGYLTDNGNSYGYYTNNMDKTQLPQKKEDIHENLIDITEDEDYIYVTVELRGVDKDDLIVTPKEDSIFIQVLICGKQLQREWKLKSKVNPKTAKIKFNNCILDVRLKKVKEKKNGKK